MTQIRYIQSTERQVDEGHPVLDDTLNRALRDVLEASGVDPDADFPGFGGPVYNVKGYGAVGDGVTDDTVAIQAAITAAEAVSGQVVFPSASYLVGALTVSGNRVYLNGWGATLVASGSSLPLTISGDNNVVGGLAINTTGTSNTHAISVTGDRNLLELVAVSGDATDGTNNGRVALSGDRNTVYAAVCDTTNIAISVTGNGNTVRDCVFTNYRTGVYLAGGSGHAVLDNQFVSIAGTGVTVGMDAVTVEATTDSDISGNTILVAREHGIYLGNGATPNLRLTIARNRIRGQGGEGIKVLGGAANHAVGVVLDGNVFGAAGAASAGIHLGSCEDVVVIGGEASDLNVGLRVAGDVQRLNVTGGSYRNNSASGVSIKDAVAANLGLTFSGVLVSGNDTGNTGFNGIDVSLTNGFANKDFVFWNISGSDQQGSPTQGVTLSVAAPSGGSTLDGLTVGAISGYGNTGGPPGSITTSASVTGIALFGSGFDTAKTQNSTYTVTDADSVIRSDATSGAVTHNLPSATNRNGKRFTSVKLDASTNAVTVDPASTQTINGASTYVLRSQYQWVEYQSDGANWIIVNTGRYEAAWASKTGGYTVTDADTGLFLGGAGATLTLQSAATRTRPLVLRSTASGNWTISRAGSDTIEGGTSLVVAPGTYLSLMPNGTDWLVV